MENHFQGHEKTRKSDYCKCTLNLTNDELYKALTEIECRLNLRPIVSLSGDSMDSMYLLLLIF